MQNSIRILIATFLIAASPALAAIAPPATVDTATLLSHRIAGETVIRTPTDQPTGTMGFRIEVDETGKISAMKRDPQGDSGGPNHGANNPAIFALRAWRFRPYVVDGIAVRMRGTIKLATRPVEELWSETPARFPALPDRDFEISFARGRNLVSAGYSVSIMGDGTVRYAGAPLRADGSDVTSGNLIDGEHVTHISTAEVDALVARFRAARFFAARDGYSIGFTERPAHMMAFRRGATRKAIGYVQGPSVGMPVAVYALEQAIQDAAGSARWTSGTADTVSALEAEGFDFRSDAARQLLLRIVSGPRVSDGQAALTRALLDRGVLDGPAGSAMIPAVAAAIARSANVSLLQLAASSGWLDQVPDAILTAILIETSGNCDPVAVRILLDAGADVHVDDFRRGSALYVVSRGRTCLWNPPADAQAIIRLLLDRGADPADLDAQGQSAPTVSGTPVSGSQY